MFELYSVLHYCPIGAPEDIQYTATVMEEGIWQVEGGDQTMFPTLEEWLQSLPGSPDPSMLTVTAKLAEEHKHKEEQKVKKANKVVPKKKWNVPSLRNMPRSLSWARHIYTMIRECDLLSREDMRDAFNHLVETLLSHNDVIRTSIPYRYRRYTHGIQLESDIES